MTQNDFYVAIQAILQKAYDNGWGLDQIELQGQDAIDEFLGEMDLELCDDFPEEDGEE